MLIREKEKNDGIKKEDKETHTDETEGRSDNTRKKRKSWKDKKTGDEVREER